MTIHLPNTYTIRKAYQKAPAAIAIIAFGLIGSIFWISSQAATFVSSGEAEAGTLTTNATQVSDAAASGGGAIHFGEPTPPAPTPTPTPQPFTLPATSVLRSSPKKVFAHYVPSLPISLNNKPPDSDYYASVYLNPEGEAGKYRTVGGFVRSRPLPRQPLTGNWQLEDMKTEVRRATAAGIDGFSINIFGPTGPNLDRTKLLMQAAAEIDPGFKIMLMPDADVLLKPTTTRPALTPSQLADLISTLADSSAAYRLADNRLVVAPFNAEDGSPAYWKDFMDQMAAKGKPVAFVPVFIDSSTRSQYESISYGYSNWGNRSVRTNQNIAANITAAHSAGKIWMQPVSGQDARPRSRIYDEANNTENLRLTWQSSIDSNADWVQLTTWNDYAEGTQFSPSSHTSYGLLDMSSYYLARYKTTSTPAITRDALYINHRIQFAAATPTAGSVNTDLMKLRAGSSPARDKIEIVSYLKAPASITVTIGGVAQAPYTAPAGMHTQLFDLAYGMISATASRSGATVSSLASPYTVNQNFQIQDMEYHMIGTDDR